jgi:hypothetical protein
MSASTDDCSRPYQWYVIDFWVEDIYKDFLSLVFFYLYGYWTRRLSLIFGEIVLAEMMGFVLRFRDICISWEG